MINLTAQPHIIRSTYWYHVRANDQPRNLRERLGRWLRILAERIDGLVSIGLDLNSIPPVARDRKMECIQMGVHSMERCLDSETKNAAIEKILERDFAELFEDIELTGNPSSALNSKNS